MKRTIILLVIVALGAGVWFYLNQDKFMKKPVAQEVSPQRWVVAGSDKPDTPPQPANASVIPAANATAVVNATINATATTPDNATLASGGEDQILKRDFVSDLSRYLTTRYLPGNTKKNPTPEGRFDLNIKSLNIRYGVDFPGMAVDPVDTLGARRIVFKHLLNPAIMEAIQTAYTPLFLDSLDQAMVQSTHNTLSGETVPLSPAQRKEMLTLLAGWMRNVGQVVSALCRTDSINPLVVKYLEDMEQVNQAHMNFWNVQTENATSAVVNEASTRIKTCIQNREMSRQRLLQAIVTTAGPHGMDAGELVYMAQWVYRRGQADPKALSMVGKAADLVIKTASSVERHATEATPLKPSKP